MRDHLVLNDPCTDWVPAHTVKELGMLFQSLPSLALGLAGAPVEQGHQGSLFSLIISNSSNALSWATATSFPAGEQMQQPKDSIRPEFSACASNQVERRVLPSVTRNEVEGLWTKSVARR